VTTSTPKKQPQVRPAKILNQGRRNINGAAMPQGELGFEAKVPKDFKNTEGVETVSTMDKSQSFIEVILKNLLNNNDAKEEENGELRPPV
jgi:hypothetical protein